ncbi:tripsin, putative [Metarhizium acridum CQMa 102]|uniref:Tripsin, putative n=1 Tax=Metarhizium acridum (strain CQMa 102) TaxID=655827 RepID=E9E3B2_METAQ|nr:tripsin, putative [Metarhizium acridum CQMa 102]EFY89707.1 tripsin, putative [Metarhizium acridum CQMa 102]
MKCSLLLLLAPLKAWTRQCVCGYANQDACASALAERADTYTGVASKVQPGSTCKRSESAAAAAAALPNGKQTGPQEYPFIAAVVYKPGHQRILCAGAIIDEHHILIAAHCVNGLQADSLAVYVGSNRFNTTAAKLETVAAIHTHPQWDPERLVYDIALLQLQDALSFDRYTTGPICVLDQPKSLDNQKAAAVAWDSATDEGQAVSSLLQATFETHDLASCSARPSGGPQFCAYAMETEDCQQDSGDPLLLLRDQSTQRYFAIGVSSYGQSCRQFPEVVTDVTQLRPWMQSVLQADGGKICG